MQSEWVTEGGCERQRVVLDVAFTLQEEGMMVPATRRHFLFAVKLGGNAVLFVPSE